MKKKLQYAFFFSQSLRNIYSFHLNLKTTRKKRLGIENLLKVQTILCNWILSSWNAVTPECIKNGFKKAKIGLYEDLEVEAIEMEEVEEDRIIDNLEEMANLTRDLDLDIVMTSGDDFDGF